MKKNRIFHYVLFQVFIYLVLIIINIFYVIYNDDKEEYLNDIIKNKENEIKLYSLINKEINIIRANIYYMSYASSKWELIYTDKNLRKRMEFTKKCLNVLKNGGEINNNIETNNRFTNSTIKISYKKDKKNSFNLAQIEITPKLLDLEKLYKDYYNLVIMRINITSSNYNSYRLVQLIGQIQLSIKTFEPVFYSLAYRLNKLLETTVHPENWK